MRKLFEDRAATGLLVNPIPTYGNAKRRIRIEEFFLGFNQLKARRGTDFPVTGAELDFVIRLFAVPDTSDLFDYRPFCHPVHQILGRRELSRKLIERGKPKVAALRNC
jgi:hypothetical protein